jgi:hypothetical protein
MDIALTAAVSQLYHGSRDPMSASQTEVKDASSARRRVRNGALGLAALALAFYFGFIALLVYHSHH